MPAFRNAILLFITVASSYYLSGQVYFDANFENGRLDTVFLDAGEYALSPVTNIHFRVTGVTGLTPEFKIWDSVGHQLRFYHFMVYRYEGQTNWSFFDTGNKTGSVNYYHFKNNTPFLHDTVYIAYWQPYTYTDLEQYLLSISNSPFLINNGVKSTSPGGRNLYGYQVTDTTYNSCYKQNVVIIPRQHPIEFINGYFIEGMTDYLLYGTDSIANYLRRNFHFFFYPMLSPDGVAEGLEGNLFGQGLNREWEDSLSTGGTPEIDSIRPVIWNETNQDIDWAIDIHSNPGSNSLYYWWGYTQNSGMPQWQINKALDYVQAVSLYDTSSTVNGTSYQNFIQGNGVNNALNAANWFRREFGSITFTFEPTSEPMGYTGDNRYTIQQYKKAGKSLAMGFYQVHDTVNAFGGTVNITGDSLIAEVSGGHPPYAYSWTGPNTGNTPILISSLPGVYSIEVTDSLGCLWSSSILYSPLTIPEVEKTSCLTYPNPVRGFVEIDCSQFNSISKIEFFDLLGNRVFQKSVDLKEKARISLSNMTSGTYIVKIESQNEFEIHRIVITH